MTLNIKKSTGKVYRIGTRGSQLARWQANWVAASLLREGIQTEIIPIRTTGDIYSRSQFSEFPGKGFFTKEIETALLERRIDLAVHSLKDCAHTLPAGLKWAAYMEREDPADVLVFGRNNQEKLFKGGTVGTSSVRRVSLVELEYPQLKILPIRGNVPTRLAAVIEGRVDSILLAYAGIARLGKSLDLADLTLQKLDIERFVPAPGQGIVAIQVFEEEDKRLGEVWQKWNNPLLNQAIAAERWLLNQLSGGCEEALGACARFNLQHKGWHFYGFWGNSRKRVHLCGSDPLLLAQEAYSILVQR
jgi:hydroxymethylbilane synthase